jgi:hypothetical protein
LMAQPLLLCKECRSSRLFYDRLSLQFDGYRI